MLNKILKLIALVLCVATPAAAQSKKGGSSDAGKIEAPSLSGTPAMFETEVALIGADLLITDVNGGISNDNLILSIEGDNLRVFDPIQTLGGSGAGVLQVDANTVDVPFTSITGSVIVRTLGGNDLCFVDCGTQQIAASLDIDAGDGDDVIPFFSADFTGDIDALAEIVDVVSGLTFSLTGDINLTGQRAVNVITKAQLVALAGDINLIGNPGGTSIENSVGVSVIDANVFSNDGDITLTGHGGSIDSENAGISLEEGATVGSLNGAVTLNGTGGAGDSGNTGIRVFGFGMAGPTRVFSLAGPITLNGTGGGNGAEGTDANFGIHLAFGANLEAINNTAIIMNGTGGLGDYANIGINTSGGVISSQNGDITLRGNGGDSGRLDSGFNFGMEISGTSFEAVGAGAIDLHAIAGLGNYAMDGLIADGASFLTTENSISLNGETTHATLGAFGLFLTGCNVNSMGSGQVDLLGEAVVTGEFTRGIFMDATTVDTFPQLQPRRSL